MAATTVEYITEKNRKETTPLDDIPQGSDIFLVPAGGIKGVPPLIIPPGSTGDFQLLEIKPEWRAEAEYRGWTIQHLIRFHVGARVGRARAKRAKKRVAVGVVDHGRN